MAQCKTYYGDHFQSPHLEIERQIQRELNKQLKQFSIMHHSP